MNMDNLTRDERKYYETCVRRELGVFVDVEYKEFKEVSSVTPGEPIYETDVKDGEQPQIIGFTDPLTTVSEVAEKKVRRYYVGELGAGQIGPLLSLLTAVFAGGSSLRDMASRTDNIAFLEMFDEHNVITFLSIAMGEDDTDWIREHFSLRWAVKVVAPFIKYNYESFFELLKDLSAQTGSLGLTEERVRAMALGQALNQVPTE